MRMRLEQPRLCTWPAGWRLLPLRFHRLDADSILLTNLVGEHLFVTEAQLLSVVDGSCNDRPCSPGSGRSTSFRRRANGCPRNCWP